MIHAFINYTMKNQIIIKSKYNPNGNHFLLYVMSKKPIISNINIIEIQK